MRVSKFLLGLGVIFLNSAILVFICRLLKINTSWAILPSLIFGFYVDRVTDAIFNFIYLTLFFFRVSKSYLGGQITFGILLRFPKAYLKFIYLSYK